MPRVASETETISVPNATAGALESNKEVRELETKKKRLADVYRGMDRVAVQISPFYKAYFGSNMPVIINGVAVYVPVNGNTYEIPEPFAAIVRERIARVDAQVKSATRLSDVQNNLENAPGANDLISQV